MEDLDIL